MKSMTCVKSYLKSLHIELCNNFYDSDDYIDQQESLYFINEYGLERFKIFPGVISVSEGARGETGFCRKPLFIDYLRNRKDYAIVYEQYLSSKKASEILVKERNDKKV
jgi:hypothetical protein